MSAKEKAQRAEKLLAREGIQPQARFVEDEQLGARRQRARNQDPLALAGRERVERARAEAPGPDRGQGLIRFRNGPVRHGFVQRNGALGAAHDDLPAAHEAGKIDRKIPVDPADAPPHEAQIGPPEMLAQDVHVTARGEAETREKAQERGFPASVQSQHDPLFSPQDLPGDLRKDPRAVDVQAYRIQ